MQIYTSAIRDNCRIALRYELIIAELICYLFCMKSKKYPNFQINNNKKLFKTDQKQFKLRLPCLGEEINWILILTWYETQEVGVINQGGRALCFQSLAVSASTCRCPGHYLALANHSNLTTWYKSIHECVMGAMSMMWLYLNVKICGWIFNSGDELLLS